MYIETVPNRNSNPTILLRESFRDEGKVKKRTLANLTKLPSEIIENMKKLLKGATVVEKLEHAFEVVRSLPHGHVAAVLGTIKKLKLVNIIGSEDNWQHPLVLAMIAARIIDPRSKLATARGFDKETASNSLAQELGVDSADEEALYQAMDWLLERQGDIESKLAKRHLKNGSLVLYDVTSTYFEGRTCPLARIGYNRDQKKGKLQIVFGLLCNIKGCPIAVEVFEGDTGDPSTLQEQIRKIRERFGLERVILVGDRGMITEARIEHDLKPAGFDWVTALRAAQIQQLVASGAIQLSLFDEQDLGEITSADYPGERLIVCRNPRLALERARKREELLAVPRKSNWKKLCRQPDAPEDLFAEKTGSVCGSGKWSIATRLASTFTSIYKKKGSPTGATRKASQNRHRLMGSMWYAPRYRLKLLELKMSFPPTKASLMLSKPSGVTRVSILRFDLSITASLVEYERMFFFACWPTMWNGICVKLWHPFFLTMMTEKPQKPNAIRL